MGVGAGVTGTLLAIVGGVCQGKGGLLPIGKAWSGRLKRCLPIGKGLPCLQQCQPDSESANTMEITGDQQSPWKLQRKRQAHAHLPRLCTNKGSDNQPTACVYCEGSNT